ncbi:MAG: LCP family protein, partial [Eggerthellaceae bacterium]|nr:LCP family protein [Eggerthellaceae bacterium]
KKVAIGIAVLLLAVLLGAAAAVLLYLSSVNDSLSEGVTQEEQLAINDALAPVVSYDEPFYVMLIGSDRRAGADWMGARADTSIVARVDTATATVTLVSIPRDTQIYLPGYGRQKFNAAYAYGGTAGLINAAGELCGVSISHYVEVNFEELIALVDLVGGVTVNVPERIDDPDAGSIVIEAGEQTLSGDAALVFARSRQYYDGDFTRTSNQRLLIEALAKKVLDMSVAELPGVLSAASNSITTDLSVMDILNLAMQIKSAPELNIYSAMVPSVTGEEGGLSYVYAVEPDLSNMMDIVDQGGDPNDVETYAAIGSVLYQ